MKQPVFVEVKLDKIVGGGQALGNMPDGRKLFVWGGLPGEKVAVRITKKKSSFAEGVVTKILESSGDRVEPQDEDSFLSTSPWQIMSFESEQHYKSALIEEAFELHDIVLPDPIEVASDGKQFEYRNKVEFSWYGDRDENGQETLDLAFFRRGGKGKMAVQGTSLAAPEINKLADQIRDVLRSKNISGRSLKTLLIRSNQKGECVWQLYIKDRLDDIITPLEAEKFHAIGGEIIYSDPKSPASRITKRLASFGDIVLADSVLGVEFHYATEGFFQINIPVYEMALNDMRAWVEKSSFSKVVDMYSGVGSIGLTIGGDNLTLVEVNEDAVREMKRNIKDLKKGPNVQAILAASEKAIDEITNDSLIIVDPPRAGLHKDVVNKLLDVEPQRIIYLSCNPVTQARDVALLAEKYGIRYHKGYNFFPRTPHIENLVILDKIS